MENGLDIVHACRRPGSGTLAPGLCCKCPCR